MLTRRPELLEAIAYAVDKHHGQLRSGKNNTHVPYVLHCLEVTRRVRDAMMVLGFVDQEVLIAAVLHDVVEDTTATHDDVRDRFGDRVAKYVRILTVPAEILTNFPEKLNHQIATMEAETTDNFVRIIKIADKTANVRSLIDEPPDWKSNHIMAYANDSKLVVEAAMGGCRESEPKARWGMTAVNLFSDLLEVFMNQYNRVAHRYAET